MRIPLLPEVAVVAIQLRDFTALRELQSPRESHAGVAIALNLKSCERVCVGIL